MIYLASPYTDPDPEVRLSRYTSACNACAYLLKQGNIVYSPIVHWHTIANTHNLPKDFAFWREQDEHMIRLSDTFAVLQLEGWTDSKGVLSELNYASLLGKNIVYLSPEFDHNSIEYIPLCFSPR